MFFFILLPGFNTVIDLGHHLRGKNHHHHFPKPRNKKRFDIQNIQGDVQVMFETVNQRQAVFSAVGTAKKRASLNSCPVFFDKDAGTD